MGSGPTSSLHVKETYYWPLIAFPVRCIIKNSMGSQNKEEDHFDRWIINTPQTADKTTKAAEQKSPSSHQRQKAPLQKGLQQNSQSPLADELSAWGVEVPGIIAEKKAEKKSSHPVKTSPMDNKDLLKELDKEKSPENFWTVDAIPSPSSTQKAMPSYEYRLDEEKIVSRVKELLTVELSPLVERYCQDTVEKVAWEVIPDLAENLIKKEIEKIAKSTEDELSNEDAQNKQPLRRQSSEGLHHL